MSGRHVLFDIAEQIVVSGWIVGGDSVDLNILHTDGTNTYFAFQDELVSLKSDVGSRIESLNAGSTIDIDTNQSIRVAGRVEVHGAGSQADLHADTKVVVQEGGLIVGRDANDLLSISAGDLVSLMPGSAVTAGARFEDVNGTPTPIKTADGADIVINSPHELFIGGSVTSSDGMTLGAGSPKYDHSDYFNNLAAASPDHPLIGHSQYGVLLTGTLTTLADNSQLTLASGSDVIIRGNIDVLGDNSDLLLQSDRFVYVEGFLDVRDDVKIYGGVTADGTSLGRADTTLGSSVYSHVTSEIATRQAGSSIDIRGGQDVDLFGAIFAGGERGDHGVTFAGDDSSISVTAGQQVFLDTGLLASGTIELHGGTPGTDDNHLIAGNKVSVVITTAGGITSAGMTGDDSGGGIKIGRAHV